jgi:SAM-dependent methyltransferase
MKIRPFIKTQIRNVCPPVLYRLGKKMYRMIRPKSYQVNAAEDLTRYLDLHGKHLLIVGLGQGHEVPIFFDFGCIKIDAIDPVLHSAAIPYTQDPRFRLIQSSAEKIPFPDNTYDVVYSIATLEHIPDPMKACQEMLRVLKPGGIFYCHAGPLWYSAYGFHPDPYIAKLEPYFHIRYSSQEDYLQEHPDLRDNPAYLKRITECFDAQMSWFNQLPSQVYFTFIADMLRTQIPLEICFSYEPKELLDQEHALCAQFPRRDLMISGFTVVFEKTDNSLTSPL